MLFQKRNLGIVIFRKWDNHFSISVWFVLKRFFLKESLDCLDIMRVDFKNIYVLWLIDNCPKTFIFYKI